ncbi:MAG: hypothetical protein CL678_07740 [Bdellovibrionaceae bacterium]|nr:hypothetical protein [Pseudobdellovibrionaceae bacterium]|tara:strand:- start:36 stop:953 length:918 start_codon:yes stop_codon:yes gene_type:complete
MKIFTDAAEQRVQADHLFRAFLWSLLNSFCFSLMFATVKGMGEHVPLSMQIFFRGWVNVAFVSLFLLYRRVSIRTSYWGLILIRSISGLMALVCFFTATRHIPVSMVATLALLNPIYVLVVSRLLARELVSRETLFWMGLSIFGLFLAINPDFSHVSSVVPFWVLGVMFCSGVFLGIALTAVRAATATVKPEVLMFYFLVVITLFSAPIAWIDYQPISDPEVWAGLFGIGIFATLGQLGLTMAYTYAPAPICSVMSLMGNAFTILWGLLFFKEILTVQQGVGLLVLFLAIGTISLRGKGKKLTNS